MKNKVEIGTSMGKKMDFIFKTYCPAIKFTDCSFLVDRQSLKKKKTNKSNLPIQVLADTVFFCLFVWKIAKLAKVGHLLLQMWLYGGRQEGPNTKMKKIWADSLLRPQY